MKPIKLIIKGLNSFVEPQEIDFIKLTSAGFFGIFGPTGSGKSTILDGITLALYGKVARNSSNFINTHCEVASVCYEFQISESEVKRYRVEREFKRDGKTDAVRTKSAKIVELQGENSIVLEEAVTLVTAKCEEIIGLSHEDFTRTVVLPQGKFGEFLKLSGKARSEMLERLFGLQQYGDDLSFKLSKRMRKMKDIAIGLEGELLGFEDCNKELLEEKRKSFEENEAFLLEGKIQCEKAEKAYIEGEAKWKLQQEYKEEVLKQEKIFQKKAQMEQVELALKKGTAAFLVKPYLDSYENTQKGVAISREEEYKYRELTQQLEKEVLDKLTKEVVSLREKTKQQETQSEAIAKQILAYEEDRKVKEKQIAEKESRVSQIHISEEMKSKVNQGMIWLSGYEALIKRKDELTISLANKRDIYNQTKKTTQEMKLKFEEATIKLKNQEEQWEKWMGQCPGNQETLLSARENLSKLEVTWNSHHENTKRVEEEQLLYATCKRQWETLCEKEIQWEQDRKILSDQQKELEYENMVNQLRSKRKEGEPCPICGSPTASCEKVEVDTEQFQKISLQLEDLANQLQQLHNEKERKWIELEQKEKIILESREKLESLGKEYLAQSFEEAQEEFEMKRKQVNDYVLRKEQLEHTIKIFREEKSSAELAYKEWESKLSQQLAQGKELKLESDKVIQEASQEEAKIESLKQQLAIDDLELKSGEIRQNEMERSKLDGEIKKIREELKLIRIEKEAKETSKNEILFQLAEAAAILLEKEKRQKEKREAIQENVIKSVQSIDSRYEAGEENWEEIDKRWEECKNRLAQEQGKLKDLENRLLDDQAKLEKVLEEEGFQNIFKLKECLISKEEWEALKNQREEYNKQAQENRVRMEDLEKKMGENPLSQEAWQNLAIEKAKNQEQVTEWSKIHIQLQDQINAITEKLEEKKELLARQEKGNHTLAILSDLDKLLKGKRFIDYVAANQLRYVSLEAGRKLKEISGGNYGLESDENGKFLIRDYKNGGVHRDASTLSGGETFLASLSLALSLSAQIQLKGTAPLELFFLDEGFGTLDENLLEVVLDALEKVHHDGLSIGVISHLETIKSRVPVKLIVEAAESGMGGSKVAIVRN